MITVIDTGLVREDVLCLLKPIHTRKLLSMLNDARRFIGLVEYSSTTVTISELRTELATREHIPSKQEARKIRQQNAKRGK